MRAMKNFSQDNEGGSRKEEEGGDPKKGANLLLFLWSVENNRMNKVSIKDPPDNDIFDSLAQKAMKKLDKEDTTTEGMPNKKRTSSDEHPAPKHHSPNSDPATRQRAEVEAHPPVTGRGTRKKTGYSL